MPSQRRGGGRDTTSIPRTPRGEAEKNDEHDDNEANAGKERKKGEEGGNGKEGNGVEGGELRGTSEEEGGAVERLNATLAMLPAILASRDVMALLDGLGGIFEQEDVLSRPESPVKRARTSGSATESLRRAVADPCAAEKTMTTTTTVDEPSDAELVNALDAQLRQAEEPSTLPIYLSNLVCRPVDAGSRVYADPGTSDAPLDVVRCRLCSKVVLTSCFAKHLLVCTAAGTRVPGDGNGKRATSKSSDYSQLTSERGAGAGPPVAIAIGIPTGDGADAGDAKAKTKKKKKKKATATANTTAAAVGSNAAAMVPISAAGMGMGMSVGGPWLGGGGGGGGGALDKEIPTCTPIFFASGNGNGGTQEDDAGQAGGIGSQSDGAALKKRKKKTTLVSQLNKGPAAAAGGDFMYDLNESCGVVFTSGVKLGMRCTHPLLSCKLHTADQKKKVVGRALPYEQLVKKLIAERKAARAAGAAVRRGMNHESSSTNRFQPVRVSKPLVVGYGANNGMSVLRRAEMKGVLRSIFQSSKSFIQSRGGASNGVSDKAPPQQRMQVPAMRVDTPVQSYPQDLGGVGVAGGGGGGGGMKMNHMYS